ncbi:MAG: hypothetical protein IJ378_02340 [Alistipes sp.]|nr:hypothetical protein [Rikenellaceae bacterium]MBO5043768.1 hypothetical protein [Alistipes sp.]MBO5276753.1 hypothetical protein [Alistipes sp.]MBO5331290.1 hypothetical protein [Alistipes sp.]MBP3602359.1 hypothetical protein [Alistipes sp.]
MKKAVQFLLGLVIIGLIYVVATLIHTPLSFEKQLEERNADVIVKLKDIRAAERAYKSKYQQFTGDFDSLIYFILNDSLEMERKLVDEDDSVAMAQLKKAGKKNVEKYSLAVIDTIFNPRKLSKEDVQNLRYIPHTDKVEFILEAAKIMTGANVLVPVVECRAPYKMYLDTVAYRQNIINLIDDRVNNFNAYAGLKFGSMEGSNNEAGNWE